MIKWPKPVGTVTDDMQMFWTSFGINEDTPKGTKVHTEAQLKQAVRDALTLAATECKALDNDENSADFRESANWCGERIRALIKEIP